MKRVLSFVLYVYETQTDEVFGQFLKELEACPDPLNANLSFVLESATNNAPGATERQEIERSIHNSVLQRTVT